MTRPLGGSSPPSVLREYALLADGERGILVGPHGDFTWMCFPSWDSEALFAALIGGAGVYAVTPLDRYVWGGFYEAGSLIWHSRWVTASALIECREALALPTAPDRAVVLRRIVAVQGTARVRVRLTLRGDFGRRPLRSLSRGPDHCWRARLGGVRAVWAGAPGARVGPDGQGGRTLDLSLTIPEGGHHDLVLELATSATGDPPVPEGAWEGTEAAWRERVPALGQTAARRDAEHAYAVLAGLTSHGGGMVAAATMALPERAREGRSYDYRYVWIRDQCYAGQAVAGAGPHRLLDDAVRFVRDRLLDDGPHLAPAYTTSGGRVPDERSLDLPGYPGGRDLVGNRVNRQFQLDAVGEALLLFAAAARHDRLDADGWRAAGVAAAAIAARCQEADAGIWELEPRRWTHSRLICAAGLRRLGEQRGPGARAAEWSALADRLTADAAGWGVHPSGRWQRADDDPRPDAALVQAAVRGAVAAADPRTIATLASVEAELCDDFFCYRYRPDERPLGEAEGAFLLCGFFLALAWEQQRDDVRAARWFERSRSACGPARLFSEEFDVTQRQMRGNLPQAFVHALLLECAVSQRRVPGAGQAGPS
ncbi:MAG TPA: glycoside hydrolase family 15 protein [Candidatus Micrarchaeia archaeon]|nr:glycoside hydrolase family 15 protein [Candidatus Micrarchaeia archaeon]